MTSVNFEEIKERVQIHIKNAANAHCPHHMLRELEAAVRMTEESGSEVKVQIGPGPRRGENNEIVIFKILKNDQEIGVFQELRGAVISEFIRGALDMSPFGSVGNKKVRRGPAPPMPESKTKAAKRKAKRGKVEWCVTIDTGERWGKLLGSYETNQEMEALWLGYQPLPEWLKVVNEI